MCPDFGQELCLVNIVNLLFQLLFTNDRQKATKVKCKCDKSTTKQSIFVEYREIPKISPGAYIFQRPFLSGLYSERLIYKGNFVFQNRLG